MHGPFKEIAILDICYADDLYLPVPIILHDAHEAVRDSGSAAFKDLEEKIIADNEGPGDDISAVVFSRSLQDAIDRPDWGIAVA